MDRTRSCCWAVRPASASRGLGEPREDAVSTAPVHRTPQDATARSDVGHPAEATAEASLVVGTLSQQLPPPRHQQGLAVRLVVPQSKQSQVQVPHMTTHTQCIRELSPCNLPNFTSHCHPRKSNEDTGREENVCVPRCTDSSAHLYVPNGHAQRRGSATPSAVRDPEAQPWPPPPAPRRLEADTYPALRP